MAYLQMLEPLPDDPQFADTVDEEEIFMDDDERIMALSDCFIQELNVALNKDHECDFNEFLATFFESTGQRLQVGELTLPWKPEQGPMNDETREMVLHALENFLNVDQITFTISSRDANEDAWDRIQSICDSQAMGINDLYVRGVFHGHVELRIYGYTDLGNTLDLISPLTTDAEPSFPFSYRYRLRLDYTYIPKDVNLLDDWVKMSTNKQDPDYLLGEVVFNPPDLELLDAIEENDDEYDSHLHMYHSMMDTLNKWGCQPIAEESLIEKGIDCTRATYAVKETQNYRLKVDIITQDEMNMIQIENGRRVVTPIYNSIKFYVERN